MSSLKMVGTDGFNPVELPLEGLFTVTRYVKIQTILNRLDKNPETAKAYLALMIKQAIPQYKIHEQHLKILRESGLTQSHEDNTIPKDVLSVVKDNLLKQDKRKIAHSIRQIKRSRLRHAETEP